MFDINTIRRSLMSDIAPHTDVASAWMNRWIAIVQCAAQTETLYSSDIASSAGKKMFHEIGEKKPTNEAIHMIQVLRLVLKT